MSRSLVFALVFVALVGVSVAFPTGAPSAACVTMTPEHFVPPQTTPNPYKLTVFNEGNGIYTGNLEKTDASVPDFKGFLIQARAENSTVPVGFFELFSTGSKALSCQDTADSVTHDSNIFKQVISFTWTAPSEGVAGLRYVLGTGTAGLHTVAEFNEQKQLYYWIRLQQEGYSVAKCDSVPGTDRFLDRIRISGPRNHLTVIAKRHNAGSSFQPHDGAT